MSKKFGILFDMDGVLVDSEPALAQSAALALQKYGLPAVASDFEEFIGIGEDGYIGGVVKKHGGTYKKEMKETIYALYIENAPVFLKPFEGVRDIILNLRSLGLAVSVASSSDAEKVAANMKALNLTNADFDAVVTGSDVERKKPWPDIYLEAARQSGVSPTDCVVVEDAVFGIIAGKKAGATTIGFTSSLTKESLLDAGADVVVDDIRDIYSIILDFVQSRR